MIKFILQKIRTLRWFIFLAVFFSTFIVFIGVTSISSLLYENLMAEQASYITEQLITLPIESRVSIELPSIDTNVRLTYISAFISYSFIFLLIAFIFSHFAIRKINQSIDEFSQQINQIQTGKDLQNFKPTNLNFIFNELNQAFNNISELARQLGRVLNDKNLLEIKSSLLSKLVIKNTQLDDWNSYVKSTFIDISNTLPFDFICIFLTDKGQQKIKLFWSGTPSSLTKQQAEQLIYQQTQLTNNSLINSIEAEHYQLTEPLIKDFYPQQKLLIAQLEETPQVGCVQGVFIHSNAMQDPALRLSITSLLVVLLNLLGASRAISGYTQQLEKSINQSEQENSMAADVLYGHLLVNSTDQLPGINYQICSSSRFSGDIIQIKRSPTGNTFILVADATGHGLSATITVMPVISVFNAMVQKGYQLPFILNEMNKHLARDLPDDRFVAALLIEIDPVHQEISVWNGAMPAALQLNNQGEVIKEFSSKYMALGILDGDLFDGTPERLQLPKDGQLILYSDGLIEQENSNQQPFSNLRLVSALKEPKNTDDPISNIIQKVLNYAQLEQPDDDISLCQIDFSDIENQTKAIDKNTLLCNCLHTPFEWQMKVYGSQLARQSLPALCNEFMQAQNLCMPIKNWAFTVINELVQKVIDTNLLQLDLTQQHLKHQALEKLNNDYYLQLKFEGKVSEPSLIIEISDNAKDPSKLTEIPRLANIRSLADQVTVTQQGHHIQVKVG